MRLNTIWECSRSAQTISIVDKWWIRSSNRSYNSIKGVNWNIIKTDNSQVMFKSASTDLIFKSSQVRWLIPDLIFKSSQVRSVITDLIFKSSQVDLTWLDLIFAPFKPTCSPLPVWIGLKHIWDFFCRAILGFPPSTIQSGQIHSAYDLKAKSEY